MLISDIDGYPVAVTGNLNTIVLVAEDVKGSIARIVGLLPENNINIATLRLTSWPVHDTARLIVAFRRAELRLFVRLDLFAKS